MKKEKPAFVTLGISKILNLLGLIFLILVPILLSLSILAGLSLNWLFVDIIWLIFLIIFYGILKASYEMIA